MVTELILVAAVAVVVVNLLSVLVAAVRIRFVPAPAWFGRVTVIRPVAGREECDAETLESSFNLLHCDADVILCLADEGDEAMPLVRHMATRHPRVRVLVGDSAISANPKLNNVHKGWQAAHGSFVVMADSNVLLPPDAADQLVARWLPDTGLVCSPPLGARPLNFFAELECAFLNTYQARWQFVADALGYGFAMGKVMLWSRAMMDSWGGTAALADEVCEDAAATKLVRRAGFKVRLVAAPFPQLLGHRTFRQVIDRQLRWATLRRKTFPLTFAAELASTAVIPALVMVTQGPLFALAAVASWYAAEMLLALAKGWHASWRMVPAMMVRDVMIPWIFAAAWFTSGFTWRGNKILVR